MIPYFKQKPTALSLFFFAVVGLFIPNRIFAQEIPVNPALLKQKWTAAWVTCPNVPQKAYGVYHFRKQIHLATKPAKFIVHLSADNRYRFFVNGKAVCYGPARGDLYNWYYETIDLAPFLQAGKNVLAAMVWNMGEHATVAQLSNQTAFVLQGDTQDEQLVNTNDSWKVVSNKAYSPCSMDNGQRLKTYMVIGPGDHVKAADYPWDWEKLSFNDAAWLPAEKVAQPEPFGYGTDNRWTMVPRNIPLMQETLQRFSQVRQVSGIEAGSEFLTGKKPLTIPAGKKVSILIDQSVNTLAYPELLVGKGKGAVIKITYAEALFKDGHKGNRNEITGKEIIGNYDIFEPDGQPERLFRPLWQRTYRYIQLDIATKEEPLVIHDFYGRYTGYPFTEKASFSSNDASLKDIWDAGWRTARLCAGETYYDCPYYEQLQYEADTRIQALISLYVSGDDRLMRKAIVDFYNSRVPEGLTQGRYPSNRLQVIPPFSLFWISMLHDYLMHRNDDAFLKKHLGAVEGILNWFDNRIDPAKKMLGPMTWWNFTDWSASFPDMGVPPGATDGHSAIITLQYIYTLKQAAALYTHFHLPARAEACLRTAEELSKGTNLHCYDSSRGLFADTPDKKTFSQHANIMAILAGVVPEKDKQVLMKKVLSDKSLSQATFYYRFYLNQALKAADLGSLYYGELTPWREMLKAGLTTFAENPDPSRSDCHAWSASPNYDFLATICGITPLSAGFETVQIKPELGELSQVSGSMPSPKGEITVVVNRKSKKTGVAAISLPKGLNGIFVWNGKQIPLHEGKNNIQF
ncbi:alpha-L-rhamnosidase-related protein [Pedobacter sp. AW31-3R]|uniref:alpha-L-rhamnosidase-related protein n=1 Tax=Pedobacter sp. AW31-3R TaxID=3445781 RepID=UPI003F9FB6F4